MSEKDEYRRWPVIVEVVVFLALASILRADTGWIEGDKLRAFGGAADDLFGLTVFVSGDYAIVGAPESDDYVDACGSAYIFKRDGTNWLLQSKLTAPDAGWWDCFGSSVCTDGNYAIVGAIYDDGQNGSAYVFKRYGSSWVQHAKLLASDNIRGARFGCSVSISGNYAVIGSPRDNPRGERSGSAYIFKRDGENWVEQVKLVASDGAVWDHFGDSVSIDGDYAIVGARGVDKFQGSAYIFKRNGETWTEQVKLMASDGVASDFFGKSVSINGDRVIVGAQGRDDNGRYSGSAYIFKRINDSWLEEAKLLASDGESGDGFGISVSISGDYVVMGATGDDDNMGSAYIFKRDGAIWTEQAKIPGPDGGQFGYVCISAEDLIVGAPHADSGYVFKLVGGSWVQEAKLTASDVGASAEFGGSVSIDGDYAITGARHSDGYGSSYVFTCVDMNWPMQTKLTASDATYEDFFGCSVSLSGDYAIVGAYGNDDLGDSSGCAYVFKRLGTCWMEKAKLTALDSEGGDCFGWSVSISGDYAVVGALGDDANMGSAYIFKRDGENWLEKAKLSSSDHSVEDYFGCRVSIDEDYVIVGAFGDDSSKGSAYIFKRDGNTWTEQVKLTASDGASEDRFGCSVCIRGDCAIVGAEGDDPNGESSGSAYIFTRYGESWAEQKKLIASDGAAGHHFGSSVAMSNDYAIVSAVWDNENGNKSGSSYIFESISGSWVERAKITASDGAAYDNFGSCVSIDGYYALVGAPGDDDYGGDCGSAYMFISPPPGSLTLVGPNGGEQFLAGTTYDVNWVTTGSIENVLIEFSADNGKSWWQIATVTNTGSYQWIVPEVNSTQCLMQVTDISYPSVRDMSDNVFEIYPCAGRLAGDLNNDCSVDGADLSILSNKWLFKDSTVWQEKEKLTASDGTDGDVFSWSVHVSDGYAIVGAYGDDISKGSAYIFKRDGETWTEQVKLTASDGVASDYFGVSVSISYEYAIVGASGYNDSRGAVYVFKYDGYSWVQHAKLAASDATSEDYFGWSVSISGDYAIVGSMYGDGNEPDSGSAYIFKCEGDNWVPQAKLVASDGDVLDEFGCSVAIDGNYAIVGAIGNNNYVGAAYIFERYGTSWIEQAKLTASDVDSPDCFGNCVSISGDYAIVGEPLDNVSGSASGSAYVFKRIDQSWVEQAKLSAPDGAAYDYFGQSVSISSDFAVVGSYGDDDNGGSSGSVYVFAHDSEGWVYGSKLVASDGASRDEFGCAVSVSGDQIVVGAYYDDDNGDDSGSAYVFEGTKCSSADVDGDCDSDFADFAILGAQWLQKEK